MVVVIIYLFSGLTENFLIYIFSLYLSLELHTPGSHCYWTHYLVLQTCNIFCIPWHSCYHHHYSVTQPRSLGSSLKIFPIPPNLLITIVSFYLPICCFLSLSLLLDHCPGSGHSSSSLASPKSILFFVAAWSSPVYTLCVKHFGVPHCVQDKSQALAEPLRFS